MTGCWCCAVRFDDSAFDYPVLCNWCFNWCASGTHQKYDDAVHIVNGAVHQRTTERHRFTGPFLEIFEEPS